jgi:hypothetical protein
MRSSVLDAAIPRPHRRFQGYFLAASGDMADSALVVGELAPADCAAGKANAEALL